MASLHKSREGLSFLFPQTHSISKRIDTYFKSRLDVQHGEMDLNNCDLSFEVSHHYRSAQYFYTMHPCFDAALAVVSALMLPKGEAKITLRIDRIVAGNCSVTCRFPRLCVLA